MRYEMEPQLDALACAMAKVPEIAAAAADLGPSPTLRGLSAALGDLADAAADRETEDRLRYLQAAAAALGLEYGRALVVLDPLARRSPDSARIQAFLGDVALRLGRFGVAERAFGRAPQRLAEAERAFEAALALREADADGDDNVARTMLNLSEAALKRGDASDREHWLERAHAALDRVDPGQVLRAHVEHARALLAFEAGRYGEALGRFKAARRGFDTNFGVGTRLYAMTLYSIAQTEEALGLDTAPATLRRAHAVAVAATDDPDDPFRQLIEADLRSTPQRRRPI